MPKSAKNSKNTKESQSKKFTNKIAILALIVEIGIFVTAAVFGVASNKALIPALIVAVIVVVIIYLFPIFFWKKKDEKHLLWDLFLLVISAILAFGTTIFLIIIFSTHNQFIEFAYGTATPTLSPTECHICEETPCPTQETTPCPTIDITPCPTIEITPCPVVESGTEEAEQPAVITTPPWNFKDGCISQLWKYDPHSSWSHLEKLDDSCDGMDYETDFGFDARQNEGLLIKRKNFDEMHTFGIYRVLPKDPSYMKIELIINDFVSGNDNTIFRIGIGKIESDNKFNGTFIELIKKPGYFPIYIFVRDQNYSVIRLDGNVGLIYNDNKLLLECDEFESIDMTCSFSINGSPLESPRTINLPKGYDSLYFGYVIPNSGSIDVLLSDLVVNN